ncbi:glycosyl hydrolase 53 family protein, partial [Anditalea andensis]|uniref:glycosyl hydrolase 53 family protein n=1 Tax=Anditalea andensis TaxID=1048983 RepID=UPI001969BB90
MQWCRVVNNLDSLAHLLYAGCKGVIAVSPESLINLHVGTAKDTEYFYDAMQERNVPYDIIGLSYYPKWHGNLQQNIAKVSQKYDRQIM